MKTTDAPPIYRFLGFNSQGDIGPYTCYTAKNKGLVIFLKSPPRTQPTRRQIHQRNLYTLLARAWEQLTQEQRAEWELAAQRANLCITGYNLYIFSTSTRDHGPLQTIRRQTGLALDIPQGAP